MRSLLFRLPLLLLGLAMAILGIMNPLPVETTGELNGSKSGALTVQEGTDIQLPLSLTGTVSELAVTVKNAGAGRNMTLILSLTQGERTLAAESFSMEKVRPNYRLKLEPEDAATGTVMLRVRAAGEGEIDLIANSESQPLIWARRTTTQYGKAWIWCGCLLAFISFVPAARKGGTDPDD